MKSLVSFCFSSYTYRIATHNKEYRNGKATAVGNTPFLERVPEYGTLENHHFPRDLKGLCLDFIHFFGAMNSTNFVGALEYRKIHSRPNPGNNN